MLASVLIIAFSVVLFIYWFRYSCMLLLRNAMEEVAAATLEPDTRFSISDVQSKLKASHALDPLASALHRDYLVLTYLVQHAPTLELGSFEDRLLMLDYQVMQVYYRATRALFPEQARRALTEMASVLDVMVHKMGQQAGI
jgi:hypothetical protein